MLGTRHRDKQGRAHALDSLGGECAVQNTHVLHRIWTRTQVTPTPRSRKTLVWRRRQRILYDARGERPIPVRAPPLPLPTVYIPLWTTGGGWGGHEGDQRERRGSLRQHLARLCGVNGEIRLVTLRTS